jgi:hypothetical protein
MKPYTEKKSGNIIRRTFSNLVESEELTWHRDREDRIVIPLNENDWMVQFDNELPKKLKINEEFFIPKNTFHRVIKGSGDLMVEIIETNFEENEYVIYEVIEEGKKKKKKGKKDACYYKVKSRYSVWPSAYGSGSLVQCRKVGAANWGNKTNESDGDINKELINKLKKYRIPYKEFNQKMKTEWIPMWKEEYGNDIAIINENVARHLLYQIGEDLFGGVNEIDFANKSKNPTNHFQMVMYLGEFILWTSPFIYVDNNHKVISKHTAVKILDSDYEDMAVLKETYSDEKYSKELINMAHKAITRRKGKDYAPDVHELQAWIDDYLLKNENYGNSAKKQFSKDLQKDPDFIKFKEKDGEFGTPNVSSNDPFIKKKRYSRVGKESFKESIIENLNLLREITSDEAYDKFYKNLFNKDNPELDRQMYDKIIQLDPTFKKEKNKLGEYTKWLFRKDNLEVLKKTKEEDLYKIKDDLEFFNNAKIKNVLPVDKKDINKFNLGSLLDFVFSFNKEGQNVMSKGEIEKEIKKDVKKYDLPNWTIIIPETEEASCYYGKGTKWCTAADTSNRFDQYASQGDLYILINKKDPSEKYQFHFESSQFMDVKDRDIELGEFMEDNSDVYEFFSKIKGAELDFEIADSCLKKYNIDCFENYYSKKFTDDQKSTLLTSAFESDENSDSYYAVSTALNYIDYPKMKDEFRRDFIYALESSLDRRYDEENYDAKMFINLLGGFNEDNISDIVGAADLKDVDIVTKLFQIAESFNAVGLLTNYLEEENLNINFDLINTLEDLKSKFNYDEYRKTYESKLVKIKVNSYDLEEGKINVTITPKDKDGNLIGDKGETGNIDYRSMVNYLTTPQLFNEAKKTDFSKEKEQGLHGWFARQGGYGKSKGWVDCNTCKKDPETGRKKCKPCGRKEDEKRAKYPACRPTPSACGTPKKGESWGKKSNNESFDMGLIDEKMVLSNYESYSEMVAQAYVNAPDFDQSVVPSYKALMDSTKKLFKQLQSKLKVEFVDYDPYESRDQMNKDVKETGVLKITNLYNDHPLYTKEENLMLRAVHDYYTHIIANQDFGLRGELRAYNTHAKLAPPAALPALFTEIVGQVCYAIVHGDFTKQKICKLDGFDYKNVGKIENIDIVKKELQLNKDENLSMSENLSIFENKKTIKSILRESFNQEDDMAEPMTQPAPVKPKEAPSKPSTEPNIQPTRRNKPFLPMPSTQPDPKAEK